MDKRRARTPEDQAFRKQSIVDALRRVLTRRLYPLPSAQEIADEAAVTKGVVYHYFRSKEEIYLTLLLQESTQLIAEVTAVLETAPVDVGAVREIFVRACGDDILMYLGALAPSILESNTSPEFIRIFKNVHADRLEAMAEVWAQHDPSLHVPDLRNFLLRVYLIALTQWQHFRPAETVVQAFAGHPLPWICAGDLHESVRECFDWLWHGMRRGAPQAGPKG